MEADFMYGWQHKRELSHTVKVKIAAPDDEIHNKAMTVPYTDCNG
jgi:hypothetical protein